jgi:hypothetical protein
MNVKIMLNKDEEIKELAKDPEVQLKIKAAIVDGIGTRAVKAVQKELTHDIDEAVRKAVYDRRWYGLKDSVKKDIEKRAEQAVDYAIASKLCDIMENEFYSRLRKKADEYAADIDKMDVASIVEKKLKEILEHKLSR